MTKSKFSACVDCYKIFLSVFFVNSMILEWFNNRHMFLIVVLTWAKTVNPPRPLVTHAVPLIVFNLTYFINLTWWKLFYHRHFWFAVLVNTFQFFRTIAGDFFCSKLKYKIMIFLVHVSPNVCDTDLYLMTLF